MNYFKAFLAFWSFRREFYYVSLAFLLVLLMPVFAVFMLTHAGIDIISDRLATVNEENNTVEIHHPATGEVVNELDLTMAWPATGVYTLEFGQSSGFQIFHTGLDIANPYGRVGDPINIIDHGNNVTTVYAHLDSVTPKNSKLVQI